MIILLKMHHAIILSYLCVVPKREEVGGVEVEGGGAVLVLGIDHGHAGLQQVGPSRVAPHSH